ncbi:GPI mannosyltransferase 3 [Anthonomus grandis grandis]|uniref:GPI mannosyltransferase 3 n=1 Tax=Anthonomus grandis grandis TaxID=2921223 RepID=UPI002166BE06|nr:GPI mannosyltransferase 3 [Anthonomus grandis grandis]
MRAQTFKNLDVFLILVGVKLLSVVVVQTYFVPDEYYQSLEVAHKFAFGYGHLTWEWHQGIRSYAYPLIFSAFYKIMKVLRLDTPVAVIFVPRVAQALLSAYADLCFYKWSGTKKWAVFIISTSWFWFYTSSRTLINTFETCLTVIALSKFPWIGSKEEPSSSFIWLVSTLFFIRPTSAIMWFPLCLYHIAISEKSGVRLLISRYIPISLIVLVLSTLLDSLAHGSFIVTTFNFMKANIWQNVGTHYGTMPWHWYLSIGLPAVLGVLILPFLMAVLVILKQRSNHPNELAMLGTIVFSILILSFLAHKEFRFVLPLLPIIAFIASRFLSAWSRKASMWRIWMVSIIIFVSNAFPAYYMGVNHQRGTIDVMQGLREIAVKDPENVSFLFLMPCHSTPLYSHLHMNVSTRFLTCNPNLNKISNYKDEADHFYMNPNNWLRQHYPPNKPLPSHIICFDNLVPVIGNDILTRYERVKQYFHCDISVSPRIGNYVLIHERSDFDIEWTT